MSAFWQPTNPGWGNAATIAKKKPKKVTSSTSQDTYDPYAAANAGVQSIIDAMLASWEHDKQQAYDAAQREAEAEYAKAQALAEGLQKLGISQAVQQAFQNAGTAQAGLAQGFSGTIRDQAAAQAAEQQRMLSGTGQEGAVRNEGANMGNVTYGTGGFIPATALNTTGAAFGAQAALQPGFALQFGELAAAARRKQWADEELPGFTDQRLEILAKRPELLLDLLKQTQTESPSQTKLTKSTLANGQIQWYDPYTGKPVGKPQGPARTKSTSSDTPNLQAKRLANGQYVAWDPATGKTVGKAWGPVKTKASGGDDAPGTYNLQMKDRGNFTQAWDPRTGKFVGPRYPKPKKDTTTKDEGRPDGMTATQVRKARGAAYNMAKGWFDNGMKDDDGNPVKAGDLLKHMINAEQIPFDIAVRQIAKFFKPARKWFKNKPPAQQTTASVTGKGVQVPISWTGTHVSDGLGWGTNTAEDIMAAPGTPVLAPESGIVVYFHPTGAQGGGSMLIRTDSGREYWLGHIDKGVRPGTKVRRGQRVAVVSADHPRPHVHVDSRVYV